MQEKPESAGQETKNPCRIFRISSGRGLTRLGFDVSANSDAFYGNNPDFSGYEPSVSFP